MAIKNSINLLEKDLPPAIHDLARNWARHYGVNNPIEDSFRLLNYNKKKKITAVLITVFGTVQYIVTSSLHLDLPTIIWVIQLLVFILSAVLPFLWAYSMESSKHNVENFSEALAVLETHTGSFNHTSAWEKEILEKVAVHIIHLYHEESEKFKYHFNVLSALGLVNCPTANG
ncbi:MAG: hypothetical protein Q7R78_01480 [bacterium]|nr:hypothetical protein [bacterium]